MVVSAIILFIEGLKWENTAIFITNKLSSICRKKNVIISFILCTIELKCKLYCLFFLWNYSNIKTIKFGRRSKITSTSWYQITFTSVCIKLWVILYFIHTQSIWRFSIFTFKIMKKKNISFNSISIKKIWKRKMYIDMLRSWFGSSIHLKNCIQLFEKNMNEGCPPDNNNFQFIFFIAIYFVEKNEE